MIQRIFQFQETRVYEVMVPLIHIYAVRDDAPIEEAVTSAAREKVSRLPVFQQRMYNIIGIVHAFDLLGETSLHDPVHTIMRPPLYVPENRLAHQQLRLMQRRGINMAVVVDEHGGTVGIVTVEDLLEEIVGEIEDEYDEREVLYETLEDGAVQVEGADGDRSAERAVPMAAPGRRLRNHRRAGGDRARARAADGSAACGLDTVTIEVTRRRRAGRPPGDCAADRPRASRIDAMNRRGLEELLAPGAARRDDG